MADFQARTVLFTSVLLLLSACGGGGGGSSSDDSLFEEPVTPQPTPNVRFSISGQISVPALTFVDSDINDIFAPHTSNSSPAVAQQLTNVATVQGFASARGTGGNANTERFTDTADTDDYYRVSLLQGQVIRLQVVDIASTSLLDDNDDLDLFLLPTNPDCQVDGNGNKSCSSGLIGFDPNNRLQPEETITVPQDGEYLINVFAFSGASKYVLTISQPTSQSSRFSDFVPGQALVAYDTQPAASAFGMTQQQLASGEGTEWPVVMDLNATTTQARLQTTLSASTQQDPLKTYNESLYERRQTLIDIKRMAQQSGVRYAEPNFIRYAQRVPNDPLYSLQWHYPAINLPQAWDISTGEENNVIVAVLDTGVFLNHSDLSSKLVAGYDFISDAANARDNNGIDSNPDDPGDSPLRGQSSWHGTHVAGTIAAASNNGIGVSGVSWGAQIMPIRVLGQQGGLSSDIIQGLRYAAGLSNSSGTLPTQKAQIANLSLGGPGFSQAEQQVYQAVRDSGMIIVAAAGNESTSVPSYPAAYDGVISVSATDASQALAPYSNFGSTIDVAAPGGNLRVDVTADGRPDGVASTLVDDQSGQRQSAFSFLQGTSMASPHVAGVIALMKSVYPALTPALFDSLLSSGRLTNDRGVNGRDDSFGHGEIDAFKAVLEARSLANGGNPPPLPVLLQSSPSALTFAASGNQTFTVTNAGGTALTGITPSDNATWLSVALTTDNGNGLGTYTATVDTTGLADGIYPATIRLSPVVSDSSSPADLIINVALALNVNTSSGGQITQHYVLLFNADTNQQVGSIAAQPDGRYQAPGLAPGRYRVLAGSDIDADNLVCDSAETCGAYPILGAPQIVVIDNSNVTGIDIPVQVASGGEASATGLSGQSEEKTLDPSRVEITGKVLAR